MLRLRSVSLVHRCRVSGASGSVFLSPSPHLSCVVGGSYGISHSSHSSTNPSSSYHHRPFTHQPNKNERKLDTYVQGIQEEKADGTRSGSEINESAAPQDFSRKQTQTQTHDSSTIHHPVNDSNHNPSEYNPSTSSPPSDTPRSLFFDDASRVLLGLSLVLQQSSTITIQRVAEVVAHAKKHTPDLPEMGRNVAEKMRGTQETELPPPPKNLNEVPTFVQRSAQVVAKNAYDNMKPTYGVQRSPAEIQAAAQRVAIEAQQIAKDVGSAVESSANQLFDTTRLNKLANDVSGEVKSFTNNVNGEMNRVTSRVNQLLHHPPEETHVTLDSARDPADEDVIVSPPSARHENAPIFREELQSTGLIPPTPGTASSPPSMAELTLGKVVEPESPTVQTTTSVTSNEPIATSSTTSPSHPPASSPTPPTASSDSTQPPPSKSNFSTFSEERFKPRERMVPSTPLARIAGFSQIATNIFFGTIKDKVQGVLGKTEEPGTKSAPSSTGSTASTTSTNGSTSSASKPNAVLGSFLSEANTERLAEGLCRMRGAALKVGQMLSIQDESLVPPQLQAVLDRVRDGADVMPRQQLERALQTELGPNWQDSLSEFDWTPMAAASIGQVHRARLKSNGQEVVMKVQYPGVAESINSDVNNLKRLIRFVNVLPQGLYIEDTMRAAKEELALECDYSNEALAQKKFKKLASGDSAFYVPEVIDALSTKRILTTERIYGVAIDRLSPVTNAHPMTGIQGNGLQGPGQHDKIPVSEQVRNHICQSLLRLCLNELFNYRFMQTDPNWSNFLYNPNNNLIYLIDFGASRLYRKAFVDEYLRMVYACSIRDRQGIIESNIKLGFITGDESKEFLDATVQAGYIIGEPFGSDLPYDFVEGNIASRVSALSGILLRDRLTPPPKEAYTLHRKLSGAFLTCRKLEAKIQCKNDFIRVYKNHQFGAPLPLQCGSASKDPIESRLTKPE